MTTFPSPQNQGARHDNGAHAAQADSAAKQKAAATAGEAQDQAKAVAGEAAEHAKDLAATAQGHAADVKDEAVQHVQRLAGTAQESLVAQAGTQQQRLAAQARTLADDLHRVRAGEQPQSDLLRQAVSSVADRAEALTQRLETAEPADLVREVRFFAARKPGLFLASALGLGLVAGRLTRGMRDAAQQPSALSGRPAYGQAPQFRREVEPTGVQSDVTPHHLPSTVPAHTGDDAPRPVADGEPELFDQTQLGGRA